METKASSKGRWAGTLLKASGFLLALAVCAGRAQQVELPTMDGYVSEITGAASLRVDGRAVEWTGKSLEAGTALPLCGAVERYQYAGWGERPRVGDHVLVFGSWKSSRQALRAEAICRVVEPVEKEVAGAAPLERLEGPVCVADGRRLLLDAHTVVLRADGTPGTLADAHPNDWLKYKARAQARGPFVLQTLTIEPLAPTRMDDQLARLQAKRIVEPDPAAGRDGSYKVLRKTFKLPVGPELARVQTVGASLAKAIQGDSPAAAPRVQLRFAVIDGIHGEGCWSFATGDVLIARTLVNRMPEDADVAAVLATCVAEVVTGQDVMLMTKRGVVGGAEGAALVAGLFVPGVGLAAVGGMVYTAELQKHLDEQTGRISLDLLAAAGYPPLAAPQARELMENKHARQKVGPVPPPRVAYLYQALAERTRGLGE